MSVSCHGIARRRVARPGALPLGVKTAGHRGRRIHEGPVAMDIALAGMREPATSLGEVVAGVEPAVVQAIDRALAFDKPARWQSAREMFEVLRACYGRLSAHPAQPRAGVLTGHSAGGEEPSLIAQVAFGPEHYKQLADERSQTPQPVHALPLLSFR